MAKDRNVVDEFSITNGPPFRPLTPSPSPPKKGARGAINIDAEVSHCNLDGFALEVGGFSFGPF